MSTATADPAARPRPLAVAIGYLGQYAVVVAVLALFFGLSVASDAFLTSANLANVLDQSVTVGVIAVATTLAIIGGGFDLSSGAIYAVSGIVAAKAASSLGVPACLVLGVLTGMGIGIVNGLLVTVGRITSFLATLASAIMLGGLATVLSGGYIVSVSDPSFTDIGRDKLAGLKYAVWIFFAFTLLLGLLLHRTTLGRAIYAVGSNREVARLSGVRVDLVRAATFAVSGTGAGLAGVLAASNLAQGQAGTGTGLELTAIAAVAIGGTSVLGGQGAMWKTVVGVLLLSLINNGLNLLGVQPAFQSIAQGAIIAIAVAGDAFARGLTPLRRARRPSVSPPVPTS